MGMTTSEAIKRIQHHMEVHHVGEYPHIHICEALTMAIDALKEKAEREKPPVTFGDQVRRMDDEHLAWQLTSIWVGGMGGVIKTIGGEPNLEDLMKTAYPKMLAEVKGPAKLKEEPHG